MQPHLSYRRLSCLAAAGVVGLAVSLLTHVFAGAKAPVPPPPVQPLPAIGLKLDVGKGNIELPTEHILAAQTAPVPGATPGPFVNPKVKPGNVRWHADFAAACRAAQKSGKPVLLFQMMGNLDDRFC